jgi:hypothetical protein
MKKSSTQKLRIQRERLKDLRVRAGVRAGAGTIADCSVTKVTCPTPGSGGGTTTTQG